MSTGGVRLDKRVGLQGRGEGGVGLDFHTWPHTKGSVNGGKSLRMAKRVRSLVGKVMLHCESRPRTLGVRLKIYLVPLKNKEEEVPRHIFKS